MNVSSLSRLPLFRQLHINTNSGAKGNPDVMDLRAIAKAPSGGELNNVTHRIGQTVTLYISQKIPQISLLTKKAVTVMQPINSENVLNPSGIHSFFHVCIEICIFEPWLVLPNLILTIGWNVGMERVTFLYPDVGGFQPSKS